MPERSRVAVDGRKSATDKQRYATHENQFLPCSSFSCFVFEKIIFLLIIIFFFSLLPSKKLILNPIIIFKSERVPALYPEDSPKKLYFPLACILYALYMYTVRRTYQTFNIMYTAE